MTWTKDKPSERGWYWFRTRWLPEQCVEVHGPSKDLSQTRIGFGSPEKLKNLHGEWAGPIRWPGWEPVKLEQVFSEGQC